MSDFQINMLVIGTIAFVIALVTLIGFAAKWRCDARRWRKVHHDLAEMKQIDFARAALLKRYVIGYFQARDDDNAAAMKNAEMVLAQVCDREKAVTEVKW